MSGGLSFRFAIIECGKIIEACLVLLSQADGGEQVKVVQSLFQLNLVDVFRAVVEKISSLDIVKEVQFKPIQRFYEC